MIWDKELCFSWQQAITVDANSTNVIDLATTADISRRTVPMRFRVQVDTTFVGATGTMDFQLVQSAAADLSSPDVLIQSALVIAVGTWVAGYIAYDGVVPTTSKRYLGVLWNNATADFTAGKITAGLLLDTPTALASRVLGVTGY